MSEDTGNRPGQAALDYRVGTHSSFKAAMHKGLSSSSVLRSLTARQDDDPSVALLDAWACVLDVLSFYQERIANEGYLGTASERFSVRELARAIGYELSPGVAADIDLAFTLDESAEAPEKVSIPTGTKVQSVPEPGELPQIFETVEPIEARPEWNGLRPRLTRLPHHAKPMDWKRVELGQSDLYLKGTQFSLSKGDVILIVGDERAGDATSERWDIRVLSEVESNPDRNYTRISFEDGLGFQVGKTTILPAGTNPKAYVFRQKAALFGHNAPNWNLLSKEAKDGLYQTISPTQLLAPSGTDWPPELFCVRTADICQIDLDAAYPNILKGSWVALMNWASGRAKPYIEIYQVKAAYLGTRSDFAITGKTTHVLLDGNENLKDHFKLRDTTVLIQSEPLEILAYAKEPDDSPITLGSQSIVLNGAIPELPSGRNVVLAGIDPSSENPVGERVTLTECVTAHGLTTISFKPPLQNTYRRDSLRIAANVTRATHGEARREVLGSGDASKPNQQFTLRQTPLTYIQATTSTGGENSLQVRVNDILWQEVPSLYGLTAHDRAYTVRMGEDGGASLQFGDGENGARLPTGLENIVATYRIGTGLAGRVKAGQLRLLMTRALGVKSVNNPFAASGGANSENLEEARRNAPSKVMDIDRIVSLTDFENFARCYCGIGKASAVRLWDGRSHIVHITVADSVGNPVSREMREQLRRAMDRVRDKSQPIRIESISAEVASIFNLVAEIRLASEYLDSKVFPVVEQALRKAFCFQNRDLGSPLTHAEVLAVIQACEGVRAARLTEFHLAKDSGNQGTLEASLAHLDETLKPPEILPAGILYLNPAPAGIQLREWV